MPDLMRGRRFRQTAGRVSQRAVPHEEVTFDELLDAMKRAAAVLRDEEIPHALSGGLAAYARGGPETEHDVDFFLKTADAERALAALESAGYRCERPPEEWLLKAYDPECGVLIDLIFDPSGGPVTEEWLERAEELEVAAMRMPVATLEDVFVTKLLSVVEQEPDFSAALEMARSLREQIDWPEVRERTEASPFAKAFFTLIEELGIVEEAA
jgi:hypothetical protein